MSSGPNASLLELADSMHAAQMAEESDCHIRESPISGSSEEGVILRSLKFMLELLCLYFLQQTICYGLVHADLRL